MRYHSQNLNDGGSMFWNGRAWLYVGKDRHNETLHWEWSFGKFARIFAVHATFGEGDSNRDLSLHVCIPFLFSIFFIVCDVHYLKHPHRTGIAIHDDAFWVYPFVNEHEWNRKMPWWEQCICWHFPWDYDWYSAEVLEHCANLPGLAKVIFREQRGERRGSKLKSNFLDHNKEKCERFASEVYDYDYTLKNGTVQHRRATTFVDRMTWRMRWWPLLPFQKVRTCISVSFDGEVGERSGSWKGGCTGCGYEMLFGETPLECLRRMERERKFK